MGKAAALHVAPTARVPTGVLKRETELGSNLPYARHVSDHVVALDSRALMICFKLDGASFETADVRDINDWHAKLNNAWRNLADERLAIWTHIVRREDRGYPEGKFRSDFARGLDAEYRKRVTGTRLFTNDLYVTLVLHPGRDAAERAAAFFSRLRVRSKAGLEVDEEAIRTLEDKGRDLLQYLSRYGVRPLGLYEHNGLWFSEPMELLHLVLTGRPQRMPLVRGHLGHALYTCRVIFGR